MRLKLNVFVGLLLPAIIAALAVGLFEQAQELQHISNHLSANDCLSVKSEFSHFKFVGYQIAILVMIVASGIYAVSLGLYLVVRWLIETTARRFP